MIFIIIYIFIVNLLYFTLISIKTTSTSLPPPCTHTYINALTHTHTLGSHEFFFVNYFSCSTQLNKWLMFKCKMVHFSADKTVKRKTTTSLFFSSLIHSFIHSYKFFFELESYLINSVLENQICFCLRFRLYRIFQKGKNLVLEKIKLLIFHLELRVS